MFLLLFTYVFGGAIGQVVSGSFEYIGCLMPGLLIQVAAVGAGETALRADR